MLNVGDSVRIKAPFNDNYPDTYRVRSYNAAANAYTIETFDGAEIGDFDAVYLELA